MVLAAIPFGIAIGLAMGTVGGGGSVLAVPVLVYILDQPVHDATTTSLIVVTAAALAGGLGHAREGRVCWRHAIAFTLAALPGVALGTVAGEAVSGSALIGLFALIMLGAAFATWRKSRATPGPEPQRPACPPLRLAADGGAGIVIGFMTGFFGVGGGFLIVPTLAIFLALSMRLAIGTSLVVITGTSTFALIAHLIVDRDIDLGVTGAMTAAAVAGALLGVRYGGRIPQARLAPAFAAFVATIAIYLLVSAAFLGGPPGS